MYQSNKKILVTGGAGFIGSALIPELQKHDHEIHVIDNLSFGDRKLVDIFDVDFYELDILNQVALNHTIRAINPNWIIHLAAIHFIPYCNQYPVEASRTNIQGTINVLESAKSLTNLERIFFASTAAVYPICNDAVSEAGVLDPIDIYGISKLAGEHLMNEFHLQTSVPTVIGRFFNAFGPNETNAHVIPEIQKQVNSGVRCIKLGNIEPKRDFIHTHDMAIAITLLLDKFSSGSDVFNIGSGTEYSVKDIVTTFSQQLGEELLIEVDPERIRKVERMHLLADIGKLKSFINWEPRINLSEGISTLLDIHQLTLK